MNNYASQYRDELVENIIPFWMNMSPDREYGGFYSCLDRRGQVFDTDKFTWLQGRAVWMFATLFNKMDQNPRWLALAENGADFLARNGRDANGNWYFSMTRTGKPLTQPFSIFSDCYAALGFGAVYKSTGNDFYASVASETFANIMARRNDPKGHYSKTFPETRPLKSFSISMILCNLALELEALLAPALVEKLIDGLINEITTDFYKRDRGLIFENVTPDGQFSDSFEGRLINPGHGLEAMWFLMDLGNRTNNRPLVDLAGSIALSILDFSWDREYGGIFYLLDCNGNPTQQLEWDQKLWWVHVEALVCMAKFWSYTGSEAAQKWFAKIHDYTWAHFRDNEFGEWFGYLNRRGEVLLNLKGGKWKGFFHIPRALLEISECLALPTPG